MNQPIYISGYLTSPLGNIPRVSRKLNHRDILGAIMVRWSIKCISYRVEPEIYAIGNPTANSDVFASANYKFPLIIPER